MVDDDFVELLAARVAARLEAILRATWIDQITSPLGRRRHIALAKRLMAAGNLSAVLLGRAYFVRRELVDKEMSRLARAAGSRAESGSRVGELEVRQLADELGLAANAKS